MYASLSHIGPRLFNALPKELGNLNNTKVETFKSYLDKFLKTIPDKPSLPGYSARQYAESNSILHMLQGAAPSFSLLGGSAYAAGVNNEDGV